MDEVKSVDIYEQHKHKFTDNTQKQFEKTVYSQCRLFPEDKNNSFIVGYFCKYPKDDSDASLEQAVDDLIGDVNRFEHGIVGVLAKLQCIDLPDGKRAVISFPALTLDVYEESKSYREE